MASTSLPPKQVCSGDELGADQLLDTLVGLVDKSVVLREQDDRATRRGTGCREWSGARRGEFATDARVCAARHRGHYLDVARAFAASFVGPGQLALVAALARDEANLRLAFDGALADGDAAMTAELAIACWPWLICTDRSRTRALLALRRLGGPAGRRTAVRRPPCRLGDIASRVTLRRREPLSDGPGAGPFAPLLDGLAAAIDALRHDAYADCAARCDELTAVLPADERWARGWAAWVGGVAGWFDGDRDTAADAAAVGA